MHITIAKEGESTFFVIASQQCITGSYFSHLQDLNLNVQLTDKMVDIFKKAEKKLKMEEELQEKTLEE